jgi:WD40 repeat protein
VARPEARDQMIDHISAASLAEFGACLRRLRAASGLSLRALEKATRRGGQVFLAHTTTQKVERGASLPSPQWLASFLGVCGVSTRDQRKWESARRRLAATSAGPGRATVLDRPVSLRGRYWEARSRGVEDVRRIGWYFTGRTRVLRELVTWLSHPSLESEPLLAVTGDPGSGKSAVLARLVTFSDPEFRATVPARVVEAASEGTLPRPGFVDAALYVANLTVAEVVSGLASALGLGTADPEDLLDMLAKTRGPRGSRTVVLDGLDEALDPGDLARRLLFPMARDRQYGIRLLVGSRRETLDRLSIRRRIDVDSADYTRTDDLIDYVSALLLGDEEGTTPTPFRNDPQRAADVANVVSRQAKGNFLIAQLTALDLISRDRPANPHALSMGPAVGDRVAEAMAAFLRRAAEIMTQSCDLPPGISSILGCERWLRDLTTPLAFAQGDGLEDDEVWADVATKLGTGTYRSTDVRRLRDCPASALMTRLDRTGQGASWQLYHHALGTALRAGHQERQAHAAFTIALFGQMHRMGVAGDWERADGYCRTHMATHAAGAGRLDDLVVDYRFLLAAAPDHLVRCLSMVTTSRARQAADVYLRHFRELRAASADEKLSILQRAARLTRCEWLADAIEADGRALRWPVHIARWSPSPETVHLGGHSQPINGLSCGLLDGNPIVVTGGGDWRLRVWDIRTGAELFAFGSEKETDVPFRLTCATAYGAPVVAALWGEDVRVWNLATRELLVKATGDASCIARHPDDGHPICIGATDSDSPSSLGSGRPNQRERARYRIWEPLTGREIAVLSEACTRPWSFDTATVDGTPMAVTGHDDGQVLVWDLCTGERLATLPAHEGQVLSVACAAVDASLVVVSTAGGLTRVWSLGRGHALAEITRPANDLTCVSHGHVEVAILAYHTRTEPVAAGWVTYENDLGIVDLRTGESSSHNVGAGSAFRAIDATIVDGRTVAATGTHDGTAQIFDLGRLAQQPARPDALRTTAIEVAGSGSSIVTGQLDGTLQVTETEHGGRHGPRVTLAASVTSVARSAPDSRSGELITAGLANGVILAWQAQEPATAPRVLIDEPTYWLLEDQTRAVTAIGLVTIGDRPAAVAAIGSTYLRLLYLDDDTPAERIGTGGWNDYVTCTQVSGIPVAVYDTYNEDETELEMLNLSTRQVIARTNLASTKWVECLTCASCDSGVFALAGMTDGNLWIWNLTEPDSWRVVPAHPPHGVNALAACKIGDQTVALTGGSNGVIRVWGLPDGRSLDRFEMDGTIEQLAASNRHVAVAGRNGYAVISIPPTTGRP